MKHRILTAMLFIAVAAVPAFASVQNVKVSGDIDSKWVMRDNFDLGIDPSSDRHQDFFMTQTRLRVDADLTDNVSTTIALINEREWGNDGDGNAAQGDTDIDLNLAYVTLREMLYSPLTVVVGRQTLNYGNALIIGAGGPNNQATGRLANVANDLTKRTALDGIKAVLDYEPLTIDMFYAKVDENVVAGTATVERDDVDLYGVNANYQLGDQFNTTVETYFFAKTDRSLGLPANKTDKVYVPGLRVSTNPIKGLNVQLEGAWQGGRKATTHTAGTARADNIKRNAYAGQAIVSYEVPVLETYKPVLTSAYTFVSGDSNPTAATYGVEASAEEWGGWDPMFEDQSGGTIYNTLFDLTNAHIVYVAGQVSPLEDVTTKLGWTGLWLDKKLDVTQLGANSAANGYFPMRQPDSAALAYPSVTSDEHIGNEVDFDVLYDYTEDVQLGVKAGWFMPGDFFAASNQDDATQVITSVNVAF